MISGRGGHLEVHGLAGDELERFAEKAAKVAGFVDALGQRHAAHEQRSGLGALDECEGHGLPPLPPHLVDHAVVLILGNDSGHPLTIEEHRAGDRSIGPLTVRAAYYPESEGVEVSAAVPGVDQRRGKLHQIGVVTDHHVLLAHPFVHHDRRYRGLLDRTGKRLDNVQRVGTRVEPESERHARHLGPGQRTVRQRCPDHPVAKVIAGF